MENRQKIIKTVGIAVTALVVLFLAYQFLTRNARPVKLGKGASCDQVREYKMEDYYMRGIIEKDHRYKAHVNYYACNPIKKGDYVLYRFAPNFPPVVRIVRAVEGDKFELKKDSKRKAWNIIINGDLMMSGDEAHFFGTDAALPPLGLALNSRKNGLLPGDVVLFSSWAPGDLDSSVFGLTNIQDIIAKVDVIPGQYPKDYTSPYKGPTPEEGPRQEAVEVKEEPAAEKKAEAKASGEVKKEEEKVKAEPEAQSDQDSKKKKKKKKK